MVATVRYAKMLKTVSAYKTARHQKAYLNALACRPLESLSWNWISTSIFITFYFLRGNCSCI